MKLEILSRSEKRISFLIDGIDTELANAMRRIILTEVPAMAIDDVVFIENSTPLFDEIIAHRLGLVPLTTDLDSFVLKERCSCEGIGCARCQVAFQCSIQAENGKRNVYTSDIISIDPKIKPVNDKILITKMAKGSKLIFEAYARLGLGKDHAKWQPVSKITYKMYPEIRIDQEKLDDFEFKGDNENDPIVNACPPKILKWEKGNLTVTDEKKCTLCGACVRSEITPKGAIDVRPVKNKFIFFLETPGVMKPERLVLEGLKIFKEKVKRFGTLVKELSEKLEQQEDHE
ncbi:DNA-directed RNA polymerase subunit D [Candidatus Bathyarchaeota archaeon]|nr:DNA-directed RNA polymerase subunit D [Candidatus Bathyarchaeota archaeon]